MKNFVRDNWFMLVVAVVLVAAVVIGGYWLLTTKPARPAIAAQEGSEAETPEAEVIVALETPAPQPETGAQETVRTVVYRPGDLAWSADTDLKGYDFQPVGSLEVELPYLAEAWGPEGGVVFVGQAGTVTWIEGHFGGTGWYISPSADQEALVRKHVRNIEARDGKAPATAILPEGNFSLLSCYQTEAVTAGGTRKCADVGPVAKASVAPAPESAEVAPAVVEQAAAAAGPTEGEFPGSVTGPAIVEWYDGSAACGVFWLDDGQEFDYQAFGHWWKATEADWPGHRDSFIASHADCTVSQPG